VWNNGAASARLKDNTCLCLHARARKWPCAPTGCFIPGHIPSENASRLSSPIISSWGASMNCIFVFKFKLAICHVNQRKKSIASLVFQSPTAQTILSPSSRSKRETSHGWRLELCTRRNSWRRRTEFLLLSDDAKELKLCTRPNSYQVKSRPISYR
jgi:hypothetical protein